MKKLVIIILILSACLSLHAQNGKKYYKAGTEFLENLKNDDAITQFSSAIAAEPSNTDYYFSRGQVYELQQKYDEAKADFEKVLVFAPKNGEAMIRLGAIANKTHKYDQALIILNDATSLKRREHELYSEKVISLIGLGKFDQALRSSDTALLIKASAMDYYYRGLTYMKLKNDPMAKTELLKSIDKDKVLPLPRLALADLLLNTDPAEAMKQCNMVIEKNDRYTDAYMMRSKIYKKNLDYPSAINDISKNIMIDPSNSDFFLERGKLYQEFNQHTNAINDFTKYISMRPDSANAYFLRASAYENMMNYDKAIEDYNKITTLSEFDMRARKMLKEAQTRLYELNRENVPPEVSLLNPASVSDTIEIRGDANTILFSGKIKDKSKLKKFTINNESVVTVEKNGVYDFLANVNTAGSDRIVLSAVDDYDNEKVLTYPVRRTEIDAPVITLMAPYTSEDGIVISIPLLLTLQSRGR
jgi:tetratricopeptide (TPR) repeat protein